MDINTTLLKEIEDNHSILWEYGCNDSDITSFLTAKKKFLPRQRKAIRIIESIMTEHGKKSLLKCVSELAKVEHDMKELLPHQRDHVVHALLSYILGMYLNERYLDASGKKAGVFQWKLAGLFHDIGYPLQMSKAALMNPLAAKINEIKKLFGVKRTDVSFSIQPHNFDLLQNNINSFDLIQEVIDSWDLSINVRDEYREMLASDQVCHGMISALTLLYVLDLMYEKYNPERKYMDAFIPGTNINCNQKYFMEDIIPACAAIFLHNLPPRCFDKAKIDRKKAPVAFLLKLADCLQDWERPSGNDTKGLASNLFDIQIEDSGKLIVYMNIPEKRKKSIEAEIYSALLIPDIKFFDRATI